ncbi:hypothetical protein TrVFT333_006435 [Trichoderma virens FT-333]|nr:hypothetical protein TrVFT333_006435 [Trichoderma virens FT-333]
MRVLRSLGFSTARRFWDFVNRPSIKDLVDRAFPGIHRALGGHKFMIKVNEKPRPADDLLTVVRDCIIAGLMGRFPRPYDGLSPDKTGWLLADHLAYLAIQLASLCDHPSPFSLKN